MDKWILITGGTKGIGKAVAGCLAQAGYQLILTYASDEQAAERASAELTRQYAVAVELLQADITSMQAVDTIDHFLRSRSLRLDALVLQCGVYGLFDGD